MKRVVEEMDGGGAKNVRGQNAPHEGWPIVTLIEFEGDKDEVGVCLECVSEEMVEN